MTEQTVDSVMTREVHSVRSSTPTTDILDLLIRRGISAVPVLDDDGRPLGVGSEGDILAAAGRPGPAPTAANLMNRPVITIRPTERISIAARKIHAEGIRRLFVVEGDGRLVGVVARRDLLKPDTRPDPDIRHDIESRLAAHRNEVLNFGPVRVRVEAGESTLDGSMLLRSTTELIHQLAATVPGVVAVHDNLNYEVAD